MPGTSAIRTHLSSLRKLHPGSGPTVVVVGGTAGIGAAVANTFAKHFDAPRVYITGRNQSAADQVIRQMQNDNQTERAAGEPVFQFLPCDVSSLSAVRQWAKDLKEKVDKINYLVLTPGILTMQGRTETQDGLDLKLQLHYYSRFLVIHELIPLLTKATEGGEEARVLTVLDAGRGGPVRQDDLDLKNSYSLKAAAESALIYNDLMVQKFSEMHPKIAFSHAFPGFVSTGLANKTSFAMRVGFNTLAKLFATRPEVCGEYMTYGITATEYAQGWHLLGSSAQKLNPTRHQTQENKELGHLSITVVSPTDQHLVSSSSTASCHRVHTTEVTFRHVGGVWNLAGPYARPTLISVKFREKKQSCEFPALDYDTLDSHVELLCTSKELGLCVIGSHHLYCLYLDKAVLKPEDFRREDKIQLILKQGVELALKPTCSSQQKTEELNQVEVMTLISEMNSKDEHTTKSACFKLITKLQDDNFVKFFREKNGHSSLVEVIKDSKGGCLSYALRALDAYMGHYSFSGGQHLNDKIFASLTDINMNVVISALHTLNVFIDPKTNNQGASIYWKNHRKTMPLQKLAKNFTENSEFNLQMNVLVLFNNLMSLSPEEDRRSNIQMLQELFQAGVCKELMTKEGPQWNYQVWRYQRHMLDAATIDKRVIYDENNPEHSNILRSLWSILRPGTPFPGNSSEQWKTVGFQGKKPETDFRGAGLLGLKHLLYLAKSRSEKTRKMIQVQNARDIEYQYPWAASGINITAKLADIFKVGKEYTPDMDPPIFPILFSGPEMYEKIYVVLFEKFDRKWQDMNARYMEFSSVIQTIEHSMDEVMSKKPTCLSELERLLDNSLKNEVDDNAPRKSSLTRSLSDLSNQTTMDYGTSQYAHHHNASEPTSPLQRSPDPFGILGHHILTKSTSHDHLGHPVSPAGPRPARPPPRPPRSDYSSNSASYPQEEEAPSSFYAPKNTPGTGFEPATGYNLMHLTGVGAPRGLPEKATSLRNNNSNIVHNNVSHGQNNGGASGSQNNGTSGSQNSSLNLSKFRSTETPPTYKLSRPLPSLGRNPPNG
ncbi:hypothetical protein PROFUN_07657 [Planoprotostelium fungivorum]|uniref:ELMO domain-containing protein n=1 Tax=Planoprotostelium fungivorum TaxID=1890364 RepID=A0A2P6NK94_9EUKA|nr:hypothetical protein PROFUN_07657 [Planoprotostelium fungivorum]